MAKDTARANPGNQGAGVVIGEALRNRTHFEIASKYVWHCHILEHEDNDMMRAFEVL